MAINSLLKLRGKRDIEYEIDKNGCYICTSHHPDKDGYFKTKRNGKHTQIHRYIFEQCNGKIPNGMIVRHKCDNKSCINPDHLEIGTCSDNSHDMVARKRSLYGERNHKSKLTENQVVDIRSDKQHSIKELCLKYGVSQGTISNVLRRRSWTYF